MWIEAHEEKQVAQKEQPKCWKVLITAQCESHCFVESPGAAHFLGYFSVDYLQRFWVGSFIFCVQRVGSLSWEALSCILFLSFYFMNLLNFSLSPLSLFSISPVEIICSFSYSPGGCPNMHMFFIVIHCLSAEGCVVWPPILPVYWILKIKPNTWSQLPCVQMGTGAFCSCLLLRAQTQQFCVVIRVLAGSHVLAEETPQFCSHCCVVFGCLLGCLPYHWESIYITQQRIDWLRFLLKALFN